MKTKKYIAALMSMLLLVALIAGCTPTTPAPAASPAAPSAAAPSSAATPDAAPPAPPAPSSAPADGLKIVIVTSTSGIDDGSFNQDNYNGILDFIKENANATVVDIRETNLDNSIPAVANVLADYDVIVTPGFQFSGVYQLAIDNPEKKFILIDSFPADATGATVDAPNIYAMQFAEEESGFFAGVAAALETKTNKVAVANGIAYPSNVNYQFGFESGVNYANAKLGTKVTIVSLPSYAGTDVTGAKVGGNYIGSFSDEVAGKVVGEALLNEGVDIILVAAGMSGNGVFTAVKENGKAMVIGCDVDQYNDGVNGSANIILTSVLKNMRINVYRALNAVKDGTFKGANMMMKADTDSTGFVKAAGRNQLSDATIAKLDEVYELVKNGTIVPASNFNGHKPDNFPGLK